WRQIVGSCAIGVHRLPMSPFAGGSRMYVDGRVRWWAASRHLYNCRAFMSTDRGEVTVLLNALREGQRDVESRLLTLVYGELRKLAASYLRRERPDHTLQAND